MEQLDQVFNALSDPTRRAILARLAEGETALSDIAAPFAMSQTAVTKHVRVLSNAGLVSVHKRGRTRYCQLQAEPMQQAALWLESYQAYWLGQFEALGQYLREEEG
ncbi:MAG: ArsR/SmtB family transcription factor [Pseudomonadales bacterium]